MNSRERETLNQMKSILDRLDAALIVRDPGSARAAEAFDGLRKSVNQASKNRRIHQAHILSLYESLQRGASIDLIRDRVGDYLVELGISFVNDTRQAELFDIVEGEGEGLECIEPAVVEALEGGQFALVKLGRARRIEISVEDTPVVVDSALDVSTSEPQPALDPPNVNVRGRSNLVIAATGVACIIVGVIIGSALSGDNANNPVETTIPITTSVSDPPTSVAPSVTTTTELSTVSTNN